MLHKQKHLKITQVEEPKHKSQSLSLWARKNASGWRFAVTTGAVLSLIVLILNFVLTIIAHMHSSNGQTLFAGDCKLVSNLGLGAHLLINFLATILLSASNYAMQCLSAPTREEVDRAHAKLDWLDIGVSSCRNLSRVNKHRALLWALLAASSLPLHLFYNSAVYSTISAHDYTVFSANETLLSGTSDVDALGVDFSSPLFRIAFDMRSAAANNTLRRFNSSECISEYAIGFQSRLRNLILVTNDTSPAQPYSYITLQGSNIALLNSTGGEVGSVDVPFGWICGLSQYQSQKLCTNRWTDFKSDWSPFGNAVSYCLAEAVDERCELRFNPPFIVTVLVFNLFKTLALFSVVLFVKENLLLTIGDGIASFLRTKDNSTASLCLMDKTELDLWVIPQKSRSSGVYHKKPRRWGYTMNSSVGFSYLVLYVTLMAVTTTLFITIALQSRLSFKSLLSLGPGEVNPLMLLTWSLSTKPSGLTLNTIIANLPQVVLSLIYFIYNSVFTNFMLSYEWDRLASKRKGLRVSRNPHGAQRSTYFLQLPYRFGVTLLLISGLIHWCCAGSLFLVVIQLDSGTLSNVTICGYSATGVLGLLCLSTLMFLFAFFAGNCKYTGSSPAVGSCSAAISAMCHIPADECGEEAVLLPLQWGVSSSEIGVENGVTVGHCSVSSQEVEQPEDGKCYI